MLKKAGYRWVFVWAIAIVLLYIFIWAFGVSQMQTNRSRMQQQIQAEIDMLQPIAPVSAAQPLDLLSNQVIVGAYIHRISNISVKDTALNIDFDLWFRWNDPTINPSETFQLLNGEILSKENIVSLVQGNERYERYRIAAQVSKAFDTSRLPVSDEWLLLQLELGSYGEQTLQWVADNRASGQSAAAIPSALSVRQTLVGVKRLRSPSTFGDIRVTSEPSRMHSRFIYAIQVQPASIRIYIAFFQALLAAVAIALLAFFIKPIHVDPRFGLGVGAFFAAVANNVFISSSLPISQTITLASLINLVGLLTIFLTLMQSTISLYLYDTKELLRLSRFFDRVSFVVFLICYIVVNVAFPLAARS